MRIDLDRKNYLSSIIFIGIFFAIILFVIFPMVREIKEKSQQLLLEKEAHQVFIEEKKNLQSFKETYQEIERDLTIADNLLVDSEVPIEIINFLENTASSFNVLINISSVSLEQTEEYPWPSLVFSLQAFASFSDFSRFIETLESNSYLIEIHEMNIRRMKEGELMSDEFSGLSPGAIGASLSLRVFAK